MARHEKERDAPETSDTLSDASTRYNLDREPLRSEHSDSRIDIPTHRTGWDGPRRRRMAAWLVVWLILLFGAAVVIYGEEVWGIMKVWEAMVERWK